jgi:RNA polymerase sigma factor (sigma-70 family)
MGRNEFSSGAAEFVELNASTPPLETAPRTRSSLEGCSELELVAALVLRHDGAFAELFRRHYHSIVRSSQMILTNTTQSEDVGAEVLLDFWLDPEKFDPTRGTLLSFLRIKAKGRSIDLIRAESSRYRRERRDADQAKTVDAGVDAQLLSTESLTRLREALAQLPVLEREPIELAFFGGMTYVAVAQRLGLPEGTVKTRIRCGLARLRSACLAHEGEREPSTTAQLADPSLTSRVRNLEGAMND